MWSTPCSHRTRPSVRPSGSPAADSTSIGVQGRVGSGGGSQDKYVWIPLRAYERAFGSPRTLQVFARAAAASAADAEDHARVSMRAIRALRPGGRHLRRPGAGGRARVCGEPVAAHRRGRRPDLADGAAGRHRRGHEHRAGVGHATHAGDRRAPRPWRAAEPDGGRNPRRIGVVGASAAASPAARGREFSLAAPAAAAHPARACTAHAGRSPIAAPPAAASPPDGIRPCARPDSTSSTRCGASDA